MRPYRQFSARLGAALMFALRTVVANGEVTPPDRVEFNRDIRPILSDNCFQCHGPDETARKAGLRLDLRTAALDDSGGYAAIVPGDTRESELVRRILTDDAYDLMPPREKGRELSSHQKNLLARWIEEGAEYEQHWAYLPPRRHPEPAVTREDWPRNSIDRFILAKLERRGLQPAPEADPTELLRRLHFDLIGLPPSPGEVETFVGDSSPDAYEKQVDRLLASKRFGERLAIYWLDLVRYADSVGYHGDQVRGIAPYRDYVIRAFNDNMPFDQFTREQLAGDLLDRPTEAQRIATGYNRLNMVTREGGAQEKDYLARYAADRTRTTASVWLGSSLACAQCHDHKFDPFTMKDFYSFSAFFADIKENGVQSEGGNEGPFPPYILFPSEEEEKELEEITSENRRIEEELTSLPEDSGDRSELRQKLDKLKKQEFALARRAYHSVITETMEPRVTRVLARGNWMDDSGEVVQPAVPEFLGATWNPGSRDTRPTRLDLAEWLTDERNPLTARVFVNRLWKLYFGTGISRVLDDLGSRGEWPKHPELLDHLALRFMENGWDIKAIVRYIVTSGAYRQTSMAGEELKESDPYNRLLARQSRFRLEAELVRDNALKVSGLLSEKMGGAGAKPYQPAGYYRELNFPKREYEPDTGEDLYRRGVYTHWQRTFLHPSLLAFDAPVREECTAERTISNSPQQALVLLNDPSFVEAARAFAQRILQEGGESVSSRIRWAYREALSRDPLPEEDEIMTSLLAKHSHRFENDSESVAAFTGVGDKPVPADLDPIEVAAWSSVSRTLFNLHETIYRY